MNYFLSICISLFVSIGFGQQCVFVENDSLKIDSSLVVSKAKIDDVFTLCKESDKIFKWDDLQNNCEDRSNAISILLDSCGIINYKIWIFSGGKVKGNTGRLMHNEIGWGYHVATILPAMINGEYTLFVIDPATMDSPQELTTWAHGLTKHEDSFGFVTSDEVYCFTSKKLKRHGVDRKAFYNRSSTNYYWTMIGLYGINAGSNSGKVKAIFKKKKIKAHQKKFEAFVASRPL